MEINFTEKRKRDLFPFKVTAIKWQNLYFDILYKIYAMKHLSASLTSSSTGKWMQSLDKIKHLI